MKCPRMMSTEPFIRQFVRCFIVLVFSVSCVRRSMASSNSNHSLILSVQFARGRMNEMASSRRQAISKSRKPSARARWSSIHFSIRMIFALRQPTRPGPRATFFDQSVSVLCALPPHTCQLLLQRKYDYQND